MIRVRGYLAAIALLAALGATASFGTTQEEKAYCDSPFRSQDDVTYEAIKQLIQRCKITHLTDLIRKLPEDLRTQYTLMRESHSLQSPGVDPLHPRVLMFQENAKLVLGFTGDPNKEEYAQLEIKEWNPRLKRFELRTIEFPNDKPHTTKLIAAPKPSTPHFNDHPKKCAQCHDQDPHPIWGNYPKWNGAYGENEDSIIENTPEGLAFSTFLKETIPNESRYQALVWNHPLKGERGSGELPFQRSGGYLKGGNYYLRPNTVLGMGLARLQAQRLANKLRQSKKYPQYRDRFLWEEMHCSTRLNPEAQDVKQYRLKPDARVEQAFQKKSMQREKLDTWDLLKAMGSSASDASMRIRSDETSAKTPYSLIGFNGEKIILPTYNTGSDSLLELTAYEIVLQDPSLKAFHEEISKAFISYDNPYYGSQVSYPGSRPEFAKDLCLYLLGTKKKDSVDNACPKPEVDLPIHRETVKNLQIIKNETGSIQNEIQNR